MATTLVPMRWSDLDTLNHVNNVTYLQYALEAWPELKGAGELPEGAARRTTIAFKRPVLKGPEPIRIESTVTGTALHQRIGPSVHAEPAVTVTTEFDQREPSAPESEIRAAHIPVHMRYSDLDREGKIDIAKKFELFQETRVPYFRTQAALFSDHGAAVVVARIEGEFFQSIGWQAEPLDGRLWIERIGNASFGVATQLNRGDEVLATSRAVMVAFDPVTQRSASFPDAIRERLHEGLLD